MLKRKLLTVAALASLACAAGASTAAANPGEYQRFKVTLTGKAGTDKKPKPVRIVTNPFHQAEGNPPGFLESPPFATVFAHIWWPKPSVVNTNMLPGCDEKVILENPDSCPKDSEVGEKGVAEGYARPVNAPFGVGTKVALENRIFVIKGVKDTIALRVKTPLTTAIMRAKTQKATGSMAKKYGLRTDFTIPIGLIQPAPGLVSQLSNFTGILAKKTYKGKAVFGLKKCPANRKLTTAYQGEYNINLSTGDKGLGVTSAANGGFSVNEKSKIVTSTSTCKQG
jgi:hypothetical protein